MYNRENCIETSKEAERAAHGKSSQLDGHQSEAVRLINTWADYVTQKTKTTIPKSKVSDREGDDHERIRRSMRVMRTMWYHNTKPVLIHVHILHRSLDDYVFRKPGQDASEARLFHALDATWSSTKDAARYVYGRFVLELANDLEANPLTELLYVPSGVELVTENEIEQYESLRDSFKRCA